MLFKNFLFNRFQINIIAYITIVFIFSSCNNNSTSKAELGQENISETHYKLEKSLVEIKVIHKEPFHKEILSNGKLFAYNKAEVKLRIADVLEKVFVKNGDVVKKGQLIAIMNNFNYKNRLKRASNDFERAKIELQDVLLGQGYKTLDSIQIPGAVWKMACIKSGFNSAFLEFQSSEYEYQNTFVKAPIDGVVANLKSKAQNIPSLAEPFCMIIDHSSFEAAFQVIESDLENIVIDQPATVSSIAFDERDYLARITEINPMVDENGLVTVKAKINNAPKGLYEGMNVRVTVKKVIPKRLSVPKSAVVLRTGKQVVFTMEDGRAKWNYVQTDMENTTSYVIEEGLKDGDQVIISGNLNLGHDAEVQVIKNNRNN